MTTPALFAPASIQPQPRSRVLGAAWLVALGWTGLALAADPSANAHYSGLVPDEFMTRWLVLAPIRVSADSAPDESARKRAFDEDWLTDVGGEAGVMPKQGNDVDHAGNSLSWRMVVAPSTSVDLTKLVDEPEFSIAYAWAEIVMPSAQKGLLGIGSDDAIKVWLNGNPIHENWVDRGLQPDQDLVPVEWKEGRNQILLKIQNTRQSWGFACRLIGPEAKAKSLIRAARRGEIEVAQQLLDSGAAIDEEVHGLTPVQAARLSGQLEMIEFLVSKGADANAPLPEPARLVDGLFQGVLEEDMPGFAVLVARDGEILLEKAYGLANVEHRVPATPETKFRIGSISKQFTAAAILKLQEEGKLSVTNTLSLFLPDYPRGDEVTVHHLLTHTSGIHSYTSKPDFIKTVTLGVQTLEHIRSFQEDPYDFDPGQRWLYNNSGYFLMGYIIEKVSGQSYAEYLRQTFFDPLGMNDTGVHEPTAILPHEATGYSYENSRMQKSLNWDMSQAGGAGALYSTVRDLYRWNEALFNGKVLSEPTLKAAFTPVVTAQDDASEPKEDGYGYGWGIQTWRGAKEIAHSGGLNGFLSHLLRFPRENMTIAVLMNCAPPPPQAGDPGSLAHLVAEFYLRDSLAPVQKPAVDTTVSQEQLDAIVGRYDYGQEILVVTKRENRLFARLGRQPEFEIFPRTETNYFWKVVEAEITFFKDDDGRVIKGVHKQGALTIHAPRLKE